MNKKIERPLRILTLGAIFAAVAGLSGCATTESVDTLESKVNATAEAQRAANATANNALSAANDAAATAQEANQRSKETDEKIDRMFKKAMHK